MKNSGIKKISLYLFMHLAAALAALFVSDIIFLNRFSVSYTDGIRSYSLGELQNSDANISESVNEIFTAQSYDILRFVAACSILDSYDGINIFRQVDAADYYKGENPVSFELTISDLINLGKIDIEESLPSDEYSSLNSKIRSYASDWDEYLVIVNEIKDASVLFSEAYTVYNAGLGLYEGDGNNIIYTIKTDSLSGSHQVYTNVPELNSYDNRMLDEYYSTHEYYMSSDINDFVSSASRDFSRTYNDKLIMHLAGSSKNVHIWTCAEPSSAFGRGILYLLIYKGEEIGRIIRFEILLFAVFSLIWLSLFVYFTVKNSGGGSKSSDEYGLKSIDRIYIELIVLIGAALAFLLYLYYSYLVRMVDLKYLDSSSFNAGPFANSDIRAYALCAGFGLAISLSLSLFFYTIVRRIRSGIIYEYSFLKKIRELLDWFALNLSGGGKATATVLIPYILFLIINLVGQTLAVNLYKINRFISVIILICVIATDIYVGITLFLNTAEKKKLLEGIEKIRSGDTGYKIDVQNLRAENKNLAESINNIGEGINTAVNESMMEEQLRSELITNVSHDLKTPLTSIINYSEILSSREVTDEQRKEYLEIICDKSRRLKKLLEDLLEASKLSSGKLEMSIDKTLVSELLIQAMGEYEDRLSGCRLEIVHDDFPRIFVLADANALWRVLNNLFDNVCKYSLESTRVYVEMLQTEDECTIKIKNVSKSKPRFHGNELTEQFIRGDESRNTEGTGLGLYIAKNLTQAMNGFFDIVVDGDMFTALIVLPKSE